MFERFTERSRKAVVLAQEESERLRHDYIGTEHLLLGLIREEEGVAAQSLRACGVTLDEARGRVEGIVGHGEGYASQKPFTPRSKRVLGLSLREAQGLRHDHIGTEHLLLGLLAEGDGICAAVFSGLGVEPADVRREVFGRLGGGSRTRPQEDPGPLGWAREALRRSFGRYPRAEDRSAFGKFTGRTRKVVVLAQDEARRFNHDYIGTEHLLLGLIGEEEGIAARSLEAVGVVDLDEVREQVESIVGYGEEDAGAQAPFTPRVSKVLQHALLEAEQLDHDHIGTEHVLLGLVREVEGVAARELRNLEVDPDEIRREVIKRLPDGEEGSVSLDEVELEMEGGWHRTLFRGHVGDIRTETARGTLILDVDYSYRLPVDPAVTRASIDPQDVADVTRTRLAEARIETPEDAAEVAGTRLLEAFHDFLEITVSVSMKPETSDPLAPTFSVSATFRR